MDKVHLNIQLTLSTETIYTYHINMYIFIPFIIHMARKAPLAIDVSGSINNKLTFHACRKAPKQWKKWDKTARYMYNLVVCLWIDLFEQGLMHPKMPKLQPAHYETIVHNIGRLVADEVTSLNKFNLTNEIPAIMTKAVKFTINQITKVNKPKKKAALTKKK